MNSYISMLKKIEHSNKKSLHKLDMNHGISFNCIRKETILLFLLFKFVFPLNTQICQDKYLNPPPP